MTSGVLFDVDGTLVDTTYLHTVTWWEAFRDGGHDVPMAAIHRSVGMGSDKLLEHLLGPERDRSADEALRDGHSARYRAYWKRLRPLPGAADLLRACKGLGLQVALASSADPAELGALREALDADDVIDAATSAGDAAREQARAGHHRGGPARASACCRPRWCSSATRSGTSPRAPSSTSRASA